MGIIPAAGDWHGTPPRCVGLWEQVLSPSETIQRKPSSKQASEANNISRYTEKGWVAMDTTASIPVKNMLKSKIVRATTDTRARERAASRLRVPEQKLVLIARSPGEKPGVFRYHFVADQPGVAVILFAVNDTATEVTVSRIGGGSLSDAQANAYLSLLNLTHGVDHDAFASVVSAWRETGAAPATPIASVPGALHAKTVQLSASVTGRLLTAGTVLGELVASPQRHTVFGARIASSTEPALVGPLTVTAAGAIVAEEDGTASMDGEGNLTLLPLVRVDSAAVTCTISVPPFDTNGAALERVTLLGRLQAAGIVPRFFDLGAIDAALAAAHAQGRTQVDVVAATATPTVHGQDGRLDILVGQDTTLTEDETHHVNFYDNGTLINVRSGDTLARIHPPTAGQPGESLFGVKIPTQDGATLKVEVGPGVTQSDDVLTAACDGALSVRGSKVSVVDLYVLEGNVDHQTGSLRFNTGSVHVRGSVCPRFSVRAADDIFVDGNVDGGSLKAGGNIVVKGMIVGGQDGHVKANGTIHARGILDAHVEARGDITVKQEVSHATVVTHGCLTVKQADGWICGGTVEATAGIVVGRLGAPAENPTAVRIGEYTDEIRERIALHKRLSDKLAAAAFDLRAFLETPAGRRPSPRRSKMEAACSTLETRIGKVKQQILSINRDLPASKASVVITQGVYPGVTVEICGLQFPVLRPWSADRIVVDPDTRLICLASTGGDLTHPRKEAA